MLRTLLLFAFAAIVSSPSLSCSKREQASSATPVVTSANPRASSEVAPASSAPSTSFYSPVLRSPGDVMATVEMPTGTQIRGLAKAVDNLSPGSSAKLAAMLPIILGQGLGMDLSAVDLNAPLALVLLNPKKYEKPATLLVRPNDFEALKKSALAAGLVVERKKDLALVGEAAAVAASKAAAFGSLEKISSEFLVRVYVGEVLASYREQIHQGFAKMTEMASQANPAASMQSMFSAYEDIVLALAEQTERLEVRVRATGSSAEFLLSMVPREGTTMASITSAQVPSKHELLAKLPRGTSSAILVSGEVHAGGAMAAMIAMSLKLMSAVMPMAQSEKTMSSLVAWLENLDGKFAIAMNMDMSNAAAPKIDATYLMGISDAKVMRGLWRTMMKAMVAGTKKGATNIMGMPFEISFDQNFFRVDGVEVDRYSTKLKIEKLSLQVRKAMSGASALQEILIATFDKVAIMAMSSDSAATMKQAIEAARGKTPGFQPSGALATALARSKQRKESLVMFMDIRAFLPPGSPPIPVSLVSMGYGKDGEAQTLRISLSK